MSEKFSDNITKIVVDYATRLQETEEEFIYQSISPFCCNVLQRKISKKELEEMLVRAERMKWIPCSERLPEESGFYMASVYCEVTKESHCRSVWFTFDDDPYAEMEWRELPSYEKVVAWMPLPESYKEGEA